MIWRLEAEELCPTIVGVMAVLRNHVKKSISKFGNISQSMLCGIMCVSRLRGSRNPDSVSVTIIRRDRLYETLRAKKWKLF